MRSHFASEYFRPFFRSPMQPTLGRRATHQDLEVEDGFCIVDGNDSGDEHGPKIRSTFLQVTASASPLSRRSFQFH